MRGPCSPLSFSSVASAPVRTSCALSLSSRCSALASSAVRTPGRCGPDRPSGANQSA
jgi:hypothetical protein